MKYGTAFNENLKKIRKAKNISQKEISEYLNIAQNTYSSYETGRREPNLNILIKIAEFLNCSTDELLTQSYSNDLSRLNKIKNLLDFIDFNSNTFSIDILKQFLKSKRIQLENLKKEIPQKIKEIDELIEFLENKESNVSEKVNKQKTNTKNLNKELEKNKKDTEIREEISIEEIYQDEFSYLKNKYEFKNIKDFFRPIDQVGDVSCGLPSYAFEDIENTYLLPKCYLYEKEKYFILKAKGDSMNKLFEEGEKILVRQSSGANNGDIVIAYIYENNEALCKKYFEEDDEVILVPCSTNEIHKVQEYNSNELCILGVVVSSLNEFLEDIDFEELEEDINDELED